MNERFVGPPAPRRRRRSHPTGASRRPMTTVRGWGAGSPPCSELEVEGVEAPSNSLSGSPSISLIGYTTARTRTSAPAGQRPWIALRTRRNGGRPRGLLRAWWMGPNGTRYSARVRTAHDGRRRRAPMSCSSNAVASAAAASCERAISSMFALPAQRRQLHRSRRLHSWSRTAVPERRRLG